ncbi:MAG: M15 family metallopeptidase [Bacteriovoracaceae bacterium]|nr:M15 family metallopeptidase [Bacteriovoracaceae bacterium]
MKFDILTGRSTSHLMELLPHQKLVHKDMRDDFERLYLAGKAAGFDIQITSCFRGFEQQLNIWNAKALGQRVLLDSHGEPIDYNTLSPEEIVLAIMRWSAIPGASRHHWGTDVDVFDGNTMKREDVQLTPQEVAPDGPSGKLHLWLNEQIKKNKSFGFFRPYSADLGGVAPEKWHLSYAPISNEFFQEYTLDVFKKNLEQSNLELAHVLLENPEFYFKQYVTNITKAPF